jgi:hypothetical protein
MDGPSECRPDVSSLPHIILHQTALRKGIFRRKHLFFPCNFLNEALFEMDIDITYKIIHDVNTEETIMAQINVNIRMDETLKRDFETVCNEMGLTMTTAFTIFAKTVSSRKEIPFRISAHPVTD